MYEVSLILRKSRFEDDDDDGGGDDVDVYLMQLDLWKHSLAVKIYFTSCFS